ncbi:serine/threonine protein kinase [Geodermatophilus sp. SYSU D01176]
MDLTGHVLGKRYRLESLIATGGMGQVWRARDVVLDRPVAVKVLRSEYTGDAAFLARFRAEARLTAGLTAPAIATLHDYGEAPGTGGVERLAFLVMELVDGESLSAVLAREGRLAAARTVRVVRQIAAGLAVAHAAGVVHRDVKPANVLVRTDGTVTITDFGIASSVAAAPITRTGQVIGTAQYLSPEQAQGERATPASDVYALGLVAYECLAGRRAFDGENSVQVAVRHIREVPPPLPPDVPAGLRRLVERMLAKAPAARLPDGAAVLAALDDVAAGRPLPPASAGSRTRVLPAAAGAAAGTRVQPGGAHDGPGDRPRSSRWRLAPLAALLLLAALAGVVVLGTSGSPAPATGTTSTPAPPAGVDVVPAAYVGRPVADVQAELTGSGLVVQLRPVQTADVPDGQVIAVDPSGRLAPGTAVTVTHALAPPPPAPAPAAPAPAAGDEGKEEEEKEKDKDKEEEEEKKKDEDE